ncbi:rod shape-determining protein MreC [Sulfurovum sp. XTW-4]|uniref:Rod shape-determining protein MreC n=1 Tax=Sulfurovum xiamenensis TaxID=3019066 RepID=A0ABT7QQF9_9BACT|nr:rod shape-determining protein MreC [Sulfurovum xiamenensis]MDM5263323.1 rod shape-determining protein MreC [Sulfurovum xiamenensis]
MKTRLVIIAILLLILTVLLSRNDERISDTFLNIINPIKQKYKNFTQNLEDKSQSYIFQKESIEKLSKENRILRKRLLEQIHYIEQIKDIYEVLPTLSHIPVKNISITDTISYVKLNSFSQIILTKPKGLVEDKLYGLIQGSVVAGTAMVHNNQLYGYLTSDKKCRFSVFIGETKAPGIALGLKENEMIVKFIPKWHKIKEGDTVLTSGLDGIFFADIPVGLVTKVEIQSSYTVAHIKTYSDIFHPKTFFLINDAKATLAENYDANRTNMATRYSTPDIHVEQSHSSEQLHDANISRPVVSSIPRRIDQTQEDVIEPIDVPEIVESSKKVNKKKSEIGSSSLDLF